MSATHFWVVTQGLRSTGIDVIKLLIKNCSALQIQNAKTNLINKFLKNIIKILGPKLRFQKFLSTVSTPSIRTKRDANANKTPCRATKQQVKGKTNGGGDPEEFLQDGRYKVTIRVLDHGNLSSFSILLFLHKYRAIVCFNFYSDLQKYDNRFKF